MYFRHFSVCSVPFSLFTEVRFGFALSASASVSLSLRLTVSRVCLSFGLVYGSSFAIIQIAMATTSRSNYPNCISCFNLLIYLLPQPTAATTATEATGDNSNTQTYTAAHLTDFRILEMRRKKNIYISIFVSILYLYLYL